MEQQERLAKNLSGIFERDTVARYFWASICPHQVGWI